VRGAATTGDQCSCCRCTLAARHIGGRPIEPRRRDGMIAYLSASQKIDGSFWPARGRLRVPVHHGPVLRGVSPARACARGRTGRAGEGVIHAHGTALACASWGKFTLALLNLYEYDGLQPVLPEFWLLPASLPFHPSRFWCHCRQVYLPMAYLYGMRARMPADELTHALRREIYDRPYDSIRFVEHRNTIAPSDVYEPTSAALKAVNLVTGLFERVHTRALRERSLARLLDHIEFEDRAPSSFALGRSTPFSIPWCTSSGRPTATRRCVASPPSRAICGTGTTAPR